MATITLIYQGRVQGSYPFKAGTLTVGSDPANDIVIAAGNVAPLHAAIQADHDQCVLRQGDGAFPVMLNGQPVREGRLKDGDRIGIGDHMLFYVDDGAHQPSSPESRPGNQAPMAGEAFLQWMSGSHIGRITPLRNSLTRLGKQDQNGSAIIAKRQGGYFFSAIDNDNSVKINGKPVGESTVQLKHADMIEIGDHQIQFFLES